MKKILLGSFITVFLTVFLTAGWACDFNSNPTKEDCKISILMDKYGVIHTFYHNPDTAKLDREKYLIVKLNDCKGSISIKEFTSSNNRLVFEGNYITHSDTTVVTKKVIDVFEMKTQADTLHYFMPLRDGIWKYYDQNGVETKIEEYKKGKRIK